MVAMNLMPWREHRRHYESKKEKWILALSALLGLMLLIVMHLVMTHYIDHAERQVEQLEAERSELIEMQRLIREKKQRATTQVLASDAKGYRLAMRNLQNEFNNQSINHHDVCFVDISRDKNILTFSGNARSAVDLTAFLKGWQAAPLFSSIKIDMMRDQPEYHLMKFRFQAIEEKEMGV